MTNQVSPANRGWIEAKEPGEPQPARVHRIQGESEREPREVHADPRQD
jgi:hypothetical protein